MRVLLRRWICKDEKIRNPRTMNSEFQPQCCAAVSAEIERGPNNLFRWPRQPRDAWLAAIALWVTPTVVVSVLAGLQPLKRTVTPLYHAAAAQWWAGQHLYNGPKGMNYLPHFALLFSPFHLLPLPVAEVPWRCCAAALIAGGLWQVVQVVFRSEADRPFFWATVLTMPLCMNALRSGQANALFGGLTLISIAALLRQRWWLASGLMVLAIAVKPLGIVLVMLAPFVYRPLRWRVLLALLVLAVFPFLFAKPGYVPDRTSRNANQPEGLRGGDAASVRRHQWPAAHLWHRAKPAILHVSAGSHGSLRADFLVSGGQAPDGTASGFLAVCADWHLPHAFQPDD